MRQCTPRFELKSTQTKFPAKFIKDGKDANLFIRKFYSDDIEIFESFFILLLNAANKTIGYAKISQGGVSGTVVDVKIIAKYAIDSLASSIILAHNHPSGNLIASKQDKEISDKIKEALKLLDVKVLDHIILSPYKKEFISMASQGLI
jgi:DNA repair protein RadC